MLFIQKKLPSALQAGSTLLEGECSRTLKKLWGDRPESALRPCFLGVMFACSAESEDCDCNWHQVSSVSEHELM